MMARRESNGKVHDVTNSIFDPIHPSKMSFLEFKTKEEEENGKNLPTEFDREPRRNDDHLMVKHIQIRAGKMVKQICLVLPFRLVGKQHPSMSKIPSS
jgi:hypothetical protein